MTTLEHIAERAKTSTEASARARITWEKLQQLAVAMNDAKTVYYQHTRKERLSLDEGIQFDLEENIIHRKFRDAEDAYQSALKRYQEQQS